MESDLQAEIEKLKTKIKNLPFVQLKPHFDHPETAGNLFEPSNNNLTIKHIGSNGWKKIYGSKALPSAGKFFYSVKIDACH